jgi:hypothetical protein
MQIVDYRLDLLPFGSSLPVPISTVELTTREAQSLREPGQVDHGLPDDWVHELSPPLRPDNPRSAVSRSSSCLIASSPDSSVESRRPASRCGQESGPKECDGFHRSSQTS